MLPLVVIPHYLKLFIKSRLFIYLEHLLQTVRAGSEDDGAVSALEISDTARTLLDDRLPIQIKQDMKIKGGSFVQ